MLNTDEKVMIRGGFHKKERIKKKIENRKIKVLSEFIHKLYQKNRKAFVHGLLSRREIENFLRGEE